MVVTTTTILKVCGGVLAGTFFLALGLTFYLSLPWAGVIIDEKPEYMDIRVEIKRANTNIKRHMFLLNDEYEIGANGVIHDIDIGCHYLIMTIKLLEDIKGYWYVYVDDKRFTKLKEEWLFDGKEGYKIYKLTCQPEWGIAFHTYKVKIIEVSKDTFYGYK